MLLRHIHLSGITRYAHAAAIQERLVASQLAHKANNSNTSDPPVPTILTAQFNPVYTCGRREVGTVSGDQKRYLTQPTPHGQAEFFEAQRGGQTTFHGPGQLIAYPVIDLRAHHLTPKNYVCLLEKSIMKLCAEYRVSAQTTENPGVWVNANEKICAVGVHLRRHVTSHGIGMNILTELAWFDRIVACGLEGKSTTSLRRLGVEGVSVEQAAAGFVRLFAQGLGGIEEVVASEYVEEPA